MPDNEEAKRRDKEEVPILTRVGNLTIEVVETVINVGVAILLAITAVALLWLAFGSTAALFGSDSAKVALEVLDTLLLVFIVAELLFAVRATVAKRELLAEPFLLAGIIASIKEIIVLSVRAAESAGKGSIFRDQMWEIGVLGVLVLLLGLSAFLLRRKEREPDEGKNDGAAPDAAGRSAYR